MGGDKAMMEGGAVQTDGIQLTNFDRQRAKINAEV
jgi:hypothetical protein